MKARKYEMPAAFKAALEQRLRNTFPSGVELARRRQLLVFDRFLARVARVLGNAAILRSGVVIWKGEEKKEQKPSVDGSRELGVVVDEKGGRWWHWRRREANWERRRKSL